MRMWEPTFRQQYVVSFKTNSMQKKISEWASCFMWFSFLDNCECFYLGLIRIIITDYKWKWTSASSVVFISLQFISQHDQASEGFICKKEEKVLILPQMKKRNWNHKLSARWCSGITRSVSQATRAWTFLILSMETGDNQEQYETEGDTSVSGDNTQGWPLISTLVLTSSPALQLSALLFSPQWMVRRCQHYILSWRSCLSLVSPHPASFESERFSVIFYWNFLMMVRCVGDGDMIILLWWVQRYKMIKNIIYVEFMQAIMSVQSQ